jgi:hypothetical protein
MWFVSIVEIHEKHIDNFINVFFHIIILVVALDLNLLNDISISIELYYLNNIGS